MKITAIKTKKIIPGQKNDIFQILNTYLPRSKKHIKEKTILAISSKIIAICQNQVIKNTGKIDKLSLIKKQAKYYLVPNKHATHKINLSIKNNTLIASAGIDESNANNYFILWPKNPQKIANEIRAFLQKKYKLKQIGVIITDSKTTPLRRGTSGFCLAHSGFKALKNYINKPDIFNRKMKVTNLNLADSLSAAAVSLMGEGAEQTPIAILQNLVNIQFQSRNPSKTELKELKISLQSDLYKKLLTSVKWQKGQGK